jgi:hypothetical protein
MYLEVDRDSYLNVIYNRLAKMHENKANIVKNTKKSFRFSKYTWMLIGILALAGIIRFHYFPFEVPLSSDALYYFWYSSEIFHIGKLPDNWSPANNGWPIFVSLFFSIFDTNDIESLMSIQRGLSVLISLVTSISVYFLCKKFVNNKFAFIGATLIAFDPRLIINSFLGVTDPLYLLLITSSIVLFLSNNKKLVYFSFILVSISTLVRVEGLIIFVILSIMFLIKYKKEKYKVLIKYILIIGIFMIIITPNIIYQTEVNGTDAIFSRVLNTGNNLVAETLIESNTVNQKNNLIEGFEILIKYLIWVMIPNFILFIPLGLFIIFQKRSFENMFIVILGGIMIIPAYYAYTIPALDTRYLYTLFPIFAVLAVVAIKKIVTKFDKENILLILIISSIIISSVLFYEYKKIDYEHENESFEIMKEVSSKVKGVNYLSTESRYLTTIQTMNQWPTPYSEISDIQIISYENENNLEDFILKSKEKGLTHIIIDNNQKRPDFLKEVFFEKEKHRYLEKIYDSKNHGFNYQLKIFEINYKMIESLKDNT